MEKQPSYDIGAIWDTYNPPVTEEEVLAAIEMLEEPTSDTVANLITDYLSRFDDEQLIELRWAFQMAGTYYGQKFTGLTLYSNIVSDLDNEKSYFRSNPDAVLEAADRFCEEFKFDNLVIEIWQAAEEIKLIAELEQRLNAAQIIKSQVMALVESYGIKPRTRYGTKEVDATWDNLVWTKGVESPSNSSMIDNYLVDTINTLESVQRLYNLGKYFEQIDLMSDEQFESLRQQYGSKAAQLIRLKNYADQIDSKRLEPLENLIHIPEFVTIAIEIYSLWLNGGDIDEHLKPIYEWSQKLKHLEGNPAGCMIRSSAVHSEDGSNLTGAGIYESVKVAAGSDYPTFKAAVIKVYKSINSDQALLYRQSNGIDTEKMGLVIQRFANIEPDEYRGERPIGYVNSIMAGRPELMEIVFQGKYESQILRNFIRRSELGTILAGFSHDHDDVQNHPAHHFRPDIHKANPTRILKEARLVGVLERLLDTMVQVEMVHDWPMLSVVQARPLPPRILEARAAVEFPNLPYCYENAAIGVGDEILEVLDINKDNRNKKGLVFVWTNHQWTFVHGAGSLPKEGAVVVLSSGGNDGHVQTICAEQRLICIFEDGRNDPFSQYTFTYNDRLRVVANGIEGRIYEI